RAAGTYHFAVGLLPLCARVEDVGAVEEAQVLNEVDVGALFDEVDQHRLVPLAAELGLALVGMSPRHEKALQFAVEQVEVEAAVGHALPEGDLEVELDLLDARILDRQPHKGRA